MIRFCHVTRKYTQGSREIIALRGVSFEAAPGEFVAICGRSGSGKSTVLNLACGIDDPSQGQIFVQGHNLADMTEKDRTMLRRHHIGIVFQFFNLIPTLTAIENAMLPAALAGTPASRARAQAMELLDGVGLAGRQDSYPDTMSGGEQQRLAIVRAMINDPQVILADEPTGNLDNDNATFVLEQLRAVSRQAGKTVLMVTHSAEAVAYADRILRLRDGQLAD